jgi:Tfp pilus assembly protein PilZ
VADRGIEARRAPRIDVRLSAEVKFEGRLFTALTRNLSVGGVCLESKVTVPDGAAIGVGLFLVFDDIEDASGPPLELVAKVAWSAPAEEPGQPTVIGLRFESVSATQLEGLTRYLKSVGE